MHVLIVFVFLLIGILIFSLCGGFFLFKSLFLRKEETSSSFKKEIPGIPAELTAHTKDPKIMDIIHEAKRTWNDFYSEEVFTVSRGATRLAGFLCVTANTNTFTLLMHGFSDSAAGMAYLAQEYTARGISVLAVDCRAHGKSGGKTIGMGYNDAFDIVAWIEFLKNRFGKNVRVILHGVSMGAAASFLYCGNKEAVLKKQYENVVCIIGDCGFSSYKRQMHDRLRHILPGFIQAPIRTAILCGASFWCALRCGFFFFQIEPIRAVKNRAGGFETIPLIIFQGANDILVPPKMAKELYNAAAGTKRLVLVEGAPHIGSYFYESENYFKIIEEAVQLLPHF